MKSTVKIGIVNFITTIRFVGILLLAPIYFYYGGLALGIVNIFCFFTDFIDGFLARKWQASTFFGSLYDGISDKAFLVANLFILASITTWTWLLVIFEIAIMGVQWLKYQKNMNVQTNFIGKIKMWVAGFTIILSNFLIDIEKLTFLRPAVIDKVVHQSDARLVLFSLSFLFLAETITFISYLIELFVLQPQGNTQVHVNTKELPALKEMLFSHTFYEKYKGKSGLRLLCLKAKKI